MKRFIYIFIAVLTISILAGCHSSHCIELPAEPVFVRDTLEVAKSATDSIETKKTTRDSIFESERIETRGDTVFVERYHYQIREISNSERARSERTDTIREHVETPVEVPVPVFVEKELTAWQKFCLKATPFFLTMAIGAGLVLLKKYRPL